LEAGKEHLSSPQLKALQEAIFKNVLAAPPQLQYFGGMTRRFDYPIAHLLSMAEIH
jgi:hypothetical protein